MPGIIDVQPQHIRPGIDQDKQTNEKRSDQANKFVRKTSAAFWKPPLPFSYLLFFPDRRLNVMMLAEPYTKGTSNTDIVCASAFPGLAPSPWPTIWTAQPRPLTFPLAHTLSPPPPPPPPNPLLSQTQDTWEEFGKTDADKERVVEAWRGNGSLVSLTSNCMASSSGSLLNTPSCFPYHPPSLLPR